MICAWHGRTKEMPNGTCPWCRMEEYGVHGFTLGPPRGDEDCYAMSFREIAEKIGTTEGNVENIQRAALRKLRARPARFKTFIALVEAAREMREARGA